MQLLNPYYAAALLSLILSAAVAADERLRMATTTSTENSGLLAELNPVFVKKYDIKLDVIAVGTGKAIRLAENGDVDLILVHAPAAELEFVEAGFGVDRKAVMYNDFVIVGPDADPAAVQGATSVLDAMLRIQQQGAAFVSRGDDSGTHNKELKLWGLAGLEPKSQAYLAVGQGMGATLQIASDKQAYTLVDRGTWLAMRDKLDLIVVNQGDPNLFNPYHVIAVNPDRHAHVSYKRSRQYIDFITGPAGQSIIQHFKVNGEVLFHPDAAVE